MVVVGWLVTATVTTQDPRGLYDTTNEEWGLTYRPPLGTATWPPVGTFSWPRTCSIAVASSADDIDADPHPQPAATASRAAASVARASCPGASCNAETVTGTLHQRAPTVESSRVVYDVVTGSCP